MVNKTEWNSAASSEKRARFLQSWEWGEFQQSLNREVARLVWNDAAYVQAIKHHLLIGKHYWYIPHGFVFKKGCDNAALWAALKDRFASDSSMFIRVDPVSPASLLNLPFTKGKKIVAATQPQCTSVLSIDRDPAELLAGMHQKTRYNLRLAERKGVVVEPGDISSFIALNKETTERDKFASHADGYYQNMAKQLPRDFLKIWQARYQDRIIASILAVYFGDTTTYVHGASSNEHRDVMAPHLLHWHVIQDAQQHGYKKYDWWGVNPKDETRAAYKKNWSGITRFKRGFGGNEVCYPDSCDLIFSGAWYSVYSLFKSIRRFVA